MLAAVQRADVLCEVRVWLPQSMRDWLERESDRRALTKSAYIRTHLAALKERQEKAA